LPEFVRIVFLLLCLSSICWLGFNLGNTCRQLQQFRSASNLFAQKKYQKAISVYDKLLQNDLTSRDLILINRGYAFSSLNQYQEMLKSCSNAISVNPRTDLGWNCRGEALYYLNQYQEALLAFDKALQINPKEVTFLLNKSNVLSDLQQYNQAIYVSEQVIQLETKSLGNNQIHRQNLAIAYGQKGKNLLKTKQYQLAFKTFETSLEYAPDNLAIKQGKGIALYQLGRYQQAKAIFTQMLERENLTTEQQVLSWLYQGTSLCEMEDLKKANQAFSQVLKLTREIESEKIAQAGCGIR